MLTVFLALAAAPVVLPPQPHVPRDMPRIRERVGPTPFENHTLSQPHRNMDNRMFPDIAIGALQIDGDTLYVRLDNRGRSASQVPIMVVARAAVEGVKSDVLEARTDRLPAGGSRWVPLTGFSAKSTSAAVPVFALANANVVSAVARLAPTTAGSLDRSGQGCDDCTADADETNNALTLSGSAIQRGRPD